MTTYVSIPADRIPGEESLSIYATYLANREALEKAREEQR